MKSKTKNKVSPGQIQALTRQHFPGATNPEIKELTDGMFNTAYLIEGGEGLPEDGVVLKIGPDDNAETLSYEKDILRAEVQVYHLLKGKAIPTPKVLAHDFSREIIPGDCFFMEKVHGATWKSAPKKALEQARPGLMRELGRCNAAVHSVRGDWFGYLKEDRRFHFTSWGAAFSAMMADIMADGRARGHKLPYDEIERVLQAHRPCLDEVSEPRLVDFDMWAGNVFVLPQGDSMRISGVVDFERSFYGDPYADFTSAVLLFEDVESEPEFCAGYAEISGAPVAVTQNDRTRMELYRLYMAVIMMVETYRYSKPYAAMVKGYVAKRIKASLDKLM